MAEFHYLESFSVSSLCSPPCLQYFEWIRTNVFLVTSRSEYLDPWMCSRVPVINALYKVPWNNALDDDCTEQSNVHTCKHTGTQLHPLKVVVGRGALSMPLMWIKGDIHIQIGLPGGPFTIPPSSPIQFWLP